MLLHVGGGLAMIELTIGQKHLLVGHVVHLNVITQRFPLLRELQVVFLAGGFTCDANRHATQPHAEIGQ